ncbi:sensor histidine kinase [Teichococcus vastitatis]|uniref:sensor histidine kinase n=1 Tax=Teichococcus vastitatis TaxID=2307076 RepID=UPI000E742732|nr:sensor histidine kinase [Pseudoroseomonas vastitatis]
MISASPIAASVFCCPDGIWQLIASPPPQDGALDPPLRSAREMEKHIAALEALNRTLRLEAQKSAEQARFQLAEMEHRLKNTFAIVDALAAQTVRPGDTSETFRTTFGARLLALARSHELLTSGYRDGAPLTELVKRCLQPCERVPGRIIVDGPAVHLPARDAPTLGLIFHELTTNAVKYGALSIPEGQIAVTWQLESKRTGHGSSVAIIWRERGGPPFRTPERRGFGLRLLERGLAHVPGSTAQLDFAPHGVDCRIWLPLDLPSAPV